MVEHDRGQSKMSVQPFSSSPPAGGRADHVLFPWKSYTPYVSVVKKLVKAIHHPPDRFDLKPEILQYREGVIILFAAVRKRAGGGGGRVGRGLKTTSRSSMWHGQDRKGERARIKCSDKSHSRSKSRTKVRSRRTSRKQSASDPHQRGIPKRF